MDNSDHIEGLADQVFEEVQSRAPKSWNNLHSIIWDEIYRLVGLSSEQESQLYKIVIAKFQ